MVKDVEAGLRVETWPVQLSEVTGLSTVAIQGRPSFRCPQLAT